MTVAGADETGAGSGATAQPAGSAAAGSGVATGSGVITGIIGVNAGSDSAALASIAGSAWSLSAIADEEAPVASRLKNAVTSPPVGTIATTVQPSPAFSVSLVARLAGS